MKTIILTLILTILPWMVGAQIIVEDSIKCSQDCWIEYGGVFCLPGTGGLTQCDTVWNINLPFIGSGIDKIISRIVCDTVKIGQYIGADMDSFSAICPVDTFINKPSYIKFDIDILRFKDSNGRTWQLVEDSTPIYPLCSTNVLYWPHPPIIGWEYSLEWRLVEEPKKDTIIECQTWYGAYCLDTIWFRCPIERDTLRYYYDFNCWGKIERQICDTVITDKSKGK